MQGDLLLSPCLFGKPILPCGRSRSHEGGDRATPFVKCLGTRNTRTLPCCRICAVPCVEKSAQLMEAQLADWWRTMARVIANSAAFMTFDSPKMGLIIRLRRADPPFNVTIISVPRSKWMAPPHRFGCGTLILIVIMAGCGVPRGFADDGTKMRSDSGVN